VLQRVAVCCSDVLIEDVPEHIRALELSLWCVEACCSVLQCVTVCCSVSQCVAVCSSVLQCVVVCCRV